MLLFIPFVLAADVVGIVAPAGSAANASLPETLVATLNEQGHEVVVGVDAVLQRIRNEGAPGLGAIDLEHKGEELLLAFEHARAAATFLEAAALLEPSLSPTVIDTWTRARTLAAVAWVEAGNSEAAQEAFARLLSLRPDVIPDASLLSPAARAAFDAARSEVGARGSGALEIHVDGAVDSDVIVDGQVRGRTPIALAGLSAGLHRVLLQAPGYEVAVAELHILPGTLLQHNVELVPTRARVTLTTLDPDSAPRLSDLGAVLNEAHLDALMVLQVDGDTVRVRRLGASPAGAHLGLAPLDTLGPRLLSALAAPAAADVDFSAALLGRRAPSPPLSVVVEPPSEASTNWWLVGSIGGGAVVVALAVVGAIAWLPQPVPERRLAVVIELPR